LGDTVPLVESVRTMCASRGDILIGESSNVSHDLLILAGYSRIIPARELRLARLGGLCFHPSLLPRHRGRDAVYWTLEHGDTVTGVTWFWITTGIDAGPIAAQARVEIPPGISRGALYYQHLVPLGLSLLPLILNQLDTGYPRRMEQDERLATYEPPRP
jgi:methionyl-tRNA formyltransferase